MSFGGYYNIFFEIDSVVKRKISAHTFLYDFLWVFNENVVQRMSYIAGHDLLDINFVHL